MTNLHLTCYLGAALRIVVRLVFLCVVTLESKAAIDTWTGGGTDNQWTTGGNWQSGVAPSSGDDLSFPWMPSAVSNYNSFSNGTVFNSITVNDGTPSLTSAYTFGGNGIVLTNGLIADGPLAADSNTSTTFDCDITLGANQTFSTSRPLIINSTLDLNAYNLTVDDSSDVILAGAVTNTGSMGGVTIVKTNTGTLTISGNVQVANLLTYLEVEVNQGTLVMDGTAINSNFFFSVNNASMVLNGEVSEAEADSSNAVISGTGFAGLLYAGENGGLFIPGDADGSPGVLKCGNFVGVPAVTLQFELNGTSPGTSYSQLLVSNSYMLYGATLLDARINYASQVGDSFLVLQQSTGTPYNFSANGCFAGQPSGSIYDTSNGYSLLVAYASNGITLTTLRTPGSPSVLWKGSGSTSNLDLVYGSRNWSSTNNWVQGLSPANGSNLVFGPYQFSVPNSAIPPITNDLPESVTLGSVLFTASNYVLEGNPLVVTDGITNGVNNGTNFFSLDLETVGPLPIEVDAGGTLLLDGSILGSDNVSKEGGGTLLYTGTTMDSFVGTVVVDNGTMQVDGSFTDGTFMVNAGLLDGTGTVSSVVMNGGTLNPGHSSGILRVQGNLTMSAGAVFESTLNGPIPGSEYNQLQIDGEVNLNGPTLDLQVGFTAAPGTSFIIIANQSTSPVSGTFAGLAEGAIFQVGGQYFSITYKAGPGNNDVVVTAVNPPGNLVGITSVSPYTVELEGIGCSNMTYTIEANTDLTTTNWIPIGTAQADGSGNFIFDDTNADHFLQQFYRVVAAP